MEPAEWQLLQTLAPHLQRAATVHDLLSRTRATTESLGAAVAAAGFAIFVLTGMPGPLRQPQGRGPRAAGDALALESSFTLSSTAPAINPLTQAVALQVGPFSATIPAGSFRKTDGLCTFVGVISGVNVQALIAPTGTLRYAFAAAAEHPNLTGTKNPVPITLTIGTDTGMKSVNALIFH